MASALSAPPDSFFSAGAETNSNFRWGILRETWKQGVHSSGMALDLYRLDINLREKKNKKYELKEF